MPKEKIAQAHLLKELGRNRDGPRRYGVREMRLLHGGYLIAIRVGNLLRVARHLGRALARMQPHRASFFSGKFLSVGQLSPDSAKRKEIPFRTELAGHVRRTLVVDSKQIFISSPRSRPLFESLAVAGSLPIEDKSDLLFSFPIRQRGSKSSADPSKPFHI